MRICTEWLSAEHRRCGSRDNVRRYLTGDRCSAHTPAAVGAGRGWFRKAPTGGAAQ